MLPLELVEKEGLIFAAEMARRQRASGRPCVHFSSARFHSPFASVLFSPLAGRGGSTKVQADRDNLGSVNCFTSTGDFETCGRCEMSQREAVPGGGRVLRRSSERATSQRSNAEGGYVTRPIATCCCSSRSTLETTPPGECSGKTAVRRGNTSSVSTRPERRG